jgi:uncharacterized protein
MRPTADELKGTLDLEPHPTCGFVRETYRSDETIPEAALPGFAGERPRASVLYFLVAPDAHIALHRIRPTQMYHHYLGDRLEVILSTRTAPVRSRPSGRWPTGSRLNC